VSIPDPYKVLQVDPEAEPEVIEAAYRRLARKYHPDVAPGPDAQERMVRLNQAWELLRDPIRRAAVDRARARAAGPGARMAAADAHVRTATGSSAGPRFAGTPSAAPDATTRPGRGQARPAGATGRPEAEWPIPGMRDPSDGEADAPRAQRVSRDWTSGRSTTGSTYDPSAMGAPQGYGAAGPPPGTPSGSVLNFGRYAGWSLGEIGRVDAEYLEWLDRMPIGRIYQQEIDRLLRSSGRRTSAPPQQAHRRGLFRRR
jgi:curved DNA-binding protein CbpA